MCLCVLQPTARRACFAASLLNYDKYNKNKIVNTNNISSNNYNNMSTRCVLCHVRLSGSNTRIVFVIVFFLLHVYFFFNRLSEWQASRDVENQNSFLTIIRAACSMSSSYELFKRRTQLTFPSPPARGVSMLLLLYLYFIIKHNIIYSRAIHRKTFQQLRKARSN